MTKENNKRLVLCFKLISVVSYLMTNATLANAQNGQSLALEEVIVTAQKRAESAQDVPIAMQAVTGDALNKLGIQTATDVTKIAPNLNISTQTPVTQAINIRGIGTNDFFSNSSGSVGIYMDEVTMSAPSLGSLGLFDIERVEVLRGPQNSLFGRNTTGGAINYISKKPIVGGDADGLVRIVYGSHNRREIQAATSFQLSNIAAIRIATNSYNRDGNFTNLADNNNDYGEKDRKSFRSTLVVEPSDTTSIIANLHWAKEDSQITPYRMVGLRNSSAGGAPAPGGPSGEANFHTSYGGVNAQGQQVDSRAWNDIYRVGSDRQEVDAVGAYIKVNHDLQWANFTGIASYDDSETAFALDLGGPGPTVNDITMLNTQDHKNEQTSVELRLASPQEDAFRWIGGLYYFSEEATYSQNMDFGPFTVVSTPNGPAPIGGSAALLALVQGFAGNGYGNQAGFSIADLENDVFSIYTHTEFDISDQLTLTFGLRYTDDSKSAPGFFVGNVDTSSLQRDTFRSEEVIRGLAAGLNACDLDGDGNATGGTTDNRGTPCAQKIALEDLNFEEWGGKIGLDYQLNDDVLLYGGYSRGFRSGKYDIEFFHGPQTGFPREDLDVETLDAFEVGLKSDLFDSSMQLNVALFYYEWNDQQLFIVDPSKGPTFTNINQAQLTGLEVELKWIPALNWQIEAGLGYLDTEVSDAGHNPTGLVEEGHELPLSPDLTGNLLLTREIAIGDNTLSLQADMQYRAQSASNVFTTTHNDKYQDFFQLNFRADYVFGSEQQYRVAVFGENLTGEEHCSYTQDLFAFSGVVYCLPNDGEPQFGIEGQIDF